ncbi:MAG: NAD kinase [Bacteroidales bacterium]|nr:NAD kinase [Bacteroidales bacterium]
MKTIALFGSKVDENIFRYFSVIKDVLKQSKISILIYKEFYESLKSSFSFTEDLKTFSSNQDLINNVDFLLSLGGDGTLLHTITLVKDSNIPIAGINTGRLGFLSTITKEETDKAICKIINGNYTLEERSLIKLDTSDNLFGEFNFALNELSVHKKDTPAMILVQAYFNNEFINAYRADGLIVSTPTGSTGYSLSCGGPIIVPQSRTFVITPIASHNLTVRPIIVPDDGVVKLIATSENNKILVSMDSRSEVIDANVEIIIKKQDFSIKLIKLQDDDFFSTIRNKLMWGKDFRN